MTQLTRQQLRQQLKAARIALTVSQQQLAAQAVRQRLHQQRYYQQAHSIAAYFAQQAELDAIPIINQALADKKKCYLPILNERQLLFGEYQANGKLKANHYGIPEPSNASILIPQELDIVCVPLVGFDRRGYRLGMGGGFYDYSFAFKIKNPLTKPLLIGLAYSIQEIAELQPESWDVPLDIIITEKETINISY